MAKTYKDFYNDLNEATSRKGPPTKLQKLWNNLQDIGVK